MPAAIMRTLAAAAPGNGAGAGDGAASFKAPCGALVDLFDIFNGRPLFDPARITAPTLIVRGADDTTSTRTDAQNLFNSLGAREKSYVDIAPGSHFLCVERNALELFRKIDVFLNDGSV